VWLGGRGCTELPANFTCTNWCLYFLILKVDNHDNGQPLYSEHSSLFRGSTVAQIVMDYLLGPISRIIMCTSFVLGHHVPVRFVSCVYKYLLEQTCTLDDLVEEDSTVYR
jgi:hypothetical protein